jgi:hypothetical protein
MRVGWHSAHWYNIMLGGVTPERKLPPGAFLAGYACSGDLQVMIVARRWI